MQEKQRYTTQLQAGLGMIPETMELLRLWEPGMSPAHLTDRVIEEGILGQGRLLESTGSDPIYYLVFPVSEILAVKRQTRTWIATLANQGWSAASADWLDLNEDEKVWFNEEINRLALLVDPDLDGLKKLLSHDFSLNHRLRDLAAQLGRKAATHRDSAHKVEVEPDPDPTTTTNEPPPKKTFATTTETIVVPKVFTSAKEIDLLVEKLNKLRHRVSPSEHLRITWKEMGTEEQWPHQ